MNRIIPLNLFCIFILLFLLSCKQSVDTVIGTPVVKAGRAKITGRITSSNDANKDSIYVHFSVSNPITGEQLKFKTVADQSGKYAIEIDVETDVSIGGGYTSINPGKTLVFKLTSESVNTINIAYNSDLDFEKIDVTPVMNGKDMTEYLKVMRKMVESHQAPKPLYDKSVDEFLIHSKNGIARRLEVLDSDKLLSKDVKELLYRDLRIWMYGASVFNYNAAMKANYYYVTKDTINTPVIKQIDRSYFRFLKDFKLNDPKYLLCYKFPEFQRKILQNEILAIPEIGESDIPSWLAKVKTVLSDLVGFSDGPYYDVLAANAYGIQLTEEVRPLSEIQKANIAAYWKNGEIAKILLRKNQQVVELNKFKSPVIVSDISSVSDDKVIETIVAKHKGRVVFIDLWATWCGPCLDAMTEFRPIKNEFHGRDIAFVYVTNESSPRKLWEEKIKGIGSEHYYLKGTQWKYVMNQFEFEYIPSYLLYDKEGVLVKKYTAFPGNEELKKVINGLL